MPPLPIGSNEFEEETKDLINKYNTPTRDVIPFQDEEVTPDPKDNFEPYAQMSNDVYNKANERNNIRDYKYLSDESNENYGVYENDDEYHIAIKGTSKDSLTKDLGQDFAIGLGSLSLGFGLSSDISEVQSKINDLKQTEKKISLSGSSKGGSIASYVGIDNPDVDTITFNKGSGLPFISDMIKCKIYGCSNIKNYRIAGDFASVIGSKIDNQLYETLRPKFPTKEEESKADQLEDFAIERDLYIPHSVSQFIGRNPNNLDSEHRYARKLASKTGRILGFGASIVAPQFIAKVGQMAATNQIIEGIVDQREAGFGNIASPVALALPVGMAGLVSPTRTNRLLPVLQQASNIGSGLNVFSRGVTGYNIGGLIGTVGYNMLYDPDI